MKGRKVAKEKTRNEVKERKVPLFWKEGESQKMKEIKNKERNETKREIKGKKEKTIPTIMEVRKSEKRKER